MLEEVHPVVELWGKWGKLSSLYGPILAFSFFQTAISVALSFTCFPRMESRHQICAAGVYGPITLRYCVYMTFFC